MRTLRLLTMVPTLLASVLVARAAAPIDFGASGMAGHAMLTRLCDDFGGRLAGTTANRGAMEQLAAELRALGYEPTRERFTMPGWARGDDCVELVAPFARRLRVAALAYSEAHPVFEAEVVAMGDGRSADYAERVGGKIGLLNHSTTLPVREFVRTAAARGLRGVLFVDREAGGQLLARTGSFVGESLPLPVYSITQEEGAWLQRLLARGRPVRVRMETRSRGVEIDTANLVLRIPGRSPETVVIGAHFDSWDLGQGALDNGLGIAQLFALAHAFRGREPERTLELIWLNAEELGLWGSRHAAERRRRAPIVTMINLDMVGVPIAVNALGDASLVPALERWNAGRTTKLPLGVQNVNWFGSDHTPFQLTGVRAITFNAPIPRESVRYYHDFADSIDKLPEKIVADSTAAIGDLVLALAADRELTAARRAPEETKALFTGFGLEPRMRGVGWWPFAANAPSH